MTEFINFNMELPRITAMKLETTDDLQSVALGINGGVNIFTRDDGSTLDEDIEVVVAGHQIVVKETDTEPTGGTVIAQIGDFVVWNQTQKTFIINTVDGQWHDSYIPEALLLPIAIRCIF